MTLQEFRKIRVFFGEMEFLFVKKPLVDPAERKAREIEYCKQLEKMLGNTRL